MVHPSLKLESGFCVQHTLIHRYSSTLKQRTYNKRDNVHGCYHKGNHCGPRSLSQRVEQRRVPDVFTHMYGYTFCVCPFEKQVYIASNYLNAIYQSTVTVSMMSKKCLIVKYKICKRAPRYLSVVHLVSFD